MHECPKNTAMKGAQYSLIQVSVKMGGGVCKIKNSVIKPFTVQPGTTVRQLLECLKKDFGAEILSKGTTVLLNGTSLDEKAAREAVLKQGDLISLFPALTGG